MKIVFLDIDGVMNNPGCYAGGHSGTHSPALPSAVAALNHITDETGACIVISSTWRLAMSLPDLKSVLREWGVTGRVYDCVPPGNYKRGDIWVSASRGATVQMWLDSGWDEGDIESFVVLDDESDMQPVQDRLVQTQGHIGLTMEDAKRAIAMLRSAHTASPQAPDPAEESANK